MKKKYYQIEQNKKGKKMRKIYQKNKMRKKAKKKKYHQNKE